MRIIEKYTNTDIVVVDTELQIGSMVDDCRVVGTDDDLQILYDQGYKEAFHFRLLLILVVELEYQRSLIQEPLLNMIVA